jgi:hypothetical protein
MSQKSSAPPTRVPAEELVRDIRRTTRKHHSAEDKNRIMDLSRFCAAPLITYCEAKETNHEHRQAG